MTSQEKHCRDAAAKADLWADKAEAAGRLEDAATLAALAAWAKERADRIAASSAKMAAVTPDDASPDPSTACRLCGSPGIRAHGGLLLACSNPACIRNGSAVAATVF